MMAERKTIAAGPTTHDPLCQRPHNIGRAICNRSVHPTQRLPLICFSNAQIKILKCFQLQIAGPLHQQIQILDPFRFPIQEIPAFAPELWQFDLEGSSRLALKTMSLKHRRFFFNRTACFTPFCCFHNRFFCTIAVFQTSGTRLELFCTQHLHHQTEQRHPHCRVAVPLDQPFPGRCKRPPELLAG